MFLSSVFVICFIFNFYLLFYIFFLQLLSLFYLLFCLQFLSSVIFKFYLQFSSSVFIVCFAFRHLDILFFYLRFYFLLSHFFVSWWCASSLLCFMFFKCFAASLFHALYFTSRGHTLIIMFHILPSYFFHFDVSCLYQRIFSHFNHSYSHSLTLSY